MTGTCGSTFGGRWVEAPRQPERTNAFRSELGRRLRPPPRPGRRRPGSAPRIELSPDVSATACNASLSGRCCDDSLNPSLLKGAADAKRAECARQRRGDGALRRSFELTTVVNRRRSSACSFASSAPTSLRVIWCVRGIRCCNMATPLGVSRIVFRRPSFESRAVERDALAEGALVEGGFTVKSVQGRELRRGDDAGNLVAPQEVHRLEGPAQQVAWVTHEVFGRTIAGHVPTSAFWSDDTTRYPTGIRRR